MAEIWQVLNEPIKVTIGGKEYQARMIPIKSVFAWAETEAVNEALSNIQKVASCLQGKEKIEYLSEATASAIPSGQLLMEKAKNKLYSLDAIKELLYQALKRDQEITREDVENIITESEIEDIQAFIPILIKGKLEKKEGEKEDEKLPSEKK